VLQEDHVLGPYLPEALHLNILENITREDRSIVHDLIASSAIQAAPIWSAWRPGVFEVVRHA